MLYRHVTCMWWTYVRLVYEQNLRDNLFLLFSLSYVVQYPESSWREIFPFLQVIWNSSVYTKEKNTVKIKNKKYVNQTSQSILLLYSKKKIFIHTYTYLYFSLSLSLSQLLCIYWFWLLVKKNRVTKYLNGMYKYITYVFFSTCVEGSRYVYMYGESITFVEVNTRSRERATATRNK